MSFDKRIHLWNYDHSQGKEYVHHPWEVPYISLQATTGLFVVTREYIYLF